MNDDQVAHAMGIDDAYQVVDVLAQGVSGATELVTIDGAGPFVRKRIPRARARRTVWAIAADCACRYLPAVRATYDTPDEFVAVCDYVAGVTLEQRVANTGRLPLSEALHVVTCVCEAAGTLHAKGVVHCDVAPGNVVLADDGAHLVDLGNARVAEPEREDAGSAALVPDPDQGAFGTWGFAAPEQYGFARVDARSDIYGVGRVLAFALTGLHPDDDGFAAALADKDVVPAAVRAAIDQACAFEPSARYQTARDLAEGLAAAATDAVAESTAGVASFAPATAVWPAQTNSGTADDPLAAGAATRPCPGVPAAHRRLRTPRPRVLVALALGALLVVGVGVAWHAFSGSEGNASASAQGAGASTGSPDAAQDEATATLLEAEDADFSGLAQQGQQGQASDACLELTETGWSAEGGYVRYAFGLKNYSANLRVDFPAVTVTGRASDGSVLFSDEQALMVAYPGATAYYGGQAGNGTAPATVEFTLHEPDSYNVHAQQDDPATFAVDNTAMVSDGFSGYVCTGEVFSTGGDLSDLAGASIGAVAVSVVLRNGDGAIVYGSSTFVDEPQDGRRASFEIPVYDAPDYATYEVYAQAW